MKGVQLSLLVSTGLGEIKLVLTTRLPHIKSEKNSKRVTTRWPGGGPGGGGAEAQSNLYELLVVFSNGRGSQTPLVYWTGWGEVFPVQPASSKKFANANNWPLTVMHDETLMYCWVGWRDPGLKKPNG
jgi:hypothetical protein